MATSIGELNLKISGNAEPVLGTVDNVRSSLSNLSKEAPKLAGGTFRRTFGGLGGDIGGKFADNFSGSLVAGVGIGAGLGLVTTLASKLLPSIEQVGEAIGDLFSNKEGKALTRELRDSAGWVENLGKNVGTTTDLMNQFAEASKKTQGGLFGGTTAAGMRTIRLRNELLQRGVDFQSDLSRMTGQDISIPLPTDRSAEGMADWMQQLNRLRTRVESAGTPTVTTPGMGVDASRAQNAMTTQLGLMGAEARLANPTAGDDMAREMIRSNALLVDGLERGAEGLQDFRLETMGASDAMREQARLSLRAAEGARLTETFRDPLETFNRERDRIETLLAGGFINADTAALATDRALQALDTGPAPELKGSAAMLAGSQEALSAISRFQLNGLRPARRSPEEILEAANRQREEQLRLGHESREELRRLRERPPVTITEARI